MQRNGVRNEIGFFTRHGINFALYGGVMILISMCLPVSLTAANFIRAGLVTGVIGFGLMFCAPRSRRVYREYEEDGEILAHSRSELEPSLGGSQSVVRAADSEHVSGTEVNPGFSK